MGYIKIGQLVFKYHTDTCTCMPTALHCQNIDPPAVCSVCEVAMDVTTGDGVDTFRAVERLLCPVVNMYNVHLQ